MSWIAPLVLGIVFGALLERGGLTRYEHVAGVFGLRDLTLVRFLLAALVAGAFVVQAASSLGLVAVLPVTPTRLVAQLVGGALFGVGMSLAGFCPGTILAGAGTGQVDYLVPGVLGLVAGAWLFDRTSGLLAPLGALADFGVTTVPHALGVSPWLVVILFAELTALLLYLVERGVRATPGERGAPRA